MYKNFNQFYKLREDKATHDAACLFVEGVLNSDLSVELIMEHVVIPALTQQSFDTPQELFTEIWNSLAPLTKMLGMGQKQPQKVAPGTNSGPDQSKLNFKPKDLENVPSSKGFRPRDQRQQSRADVAAGVVSANKEKDAANMKGQRDQVTAQHQQKLLKLKQDAETVTNAAKAYAAKELLPRIKSKTQLSPQGMDIISQFQAHLGNAIKSFAPKLDLFKFGGEADYSGVKSGMKPHHQKSIYHATNPQYSGNYDSVGGHPHTGGERTGIYTHNQDQGDAEREDRAAQAKAAARKMRNIRAN